MNKFMTKGFIGQDIKLNHFPDGTAVVNFSIADTQRWKDKETGEKKEKTEWFRMVATGKRAEAIAEYFSKGSEILIADSQARTRMYEKDGVKHYPTEYWIRDFEFCGRKSEAKGAKVAQQAQAASPESMPPIEDFNDDIPF